LAVSYGQHSVQCGTVLKPSDARKQPTVNWPSDSQKLYTLMMVDPDAPSRKRPTMGQWLHWLVVNVPGSSIDQGQTLTPYAPPTPPSGSGLHRYVFLAYQQSAQLNANSVSQRPKFSAKQFASNNGLGAPVAGNFFQTESR
uniref:Phosphatidylethanolamine-binding protein 4 (inferred by orthology to a human protein) n=1 Tax=Anisakis simplex TaxID=6269 RepID=A0A0M3J700_ANISI